MATSCLFADIGYFKDEYYVFDTPDVHPDPVRKTFFIVYTHPVSRLIEHSRTLHNHSFATHASHPITTTRCRSLQWTCDRMDHPGQLNSTLSVVASGQVTSLKVQCDIGPVRSRHLRILFFRTASLMDYPSLVQADVEHISGGSPTRKLSFRHLRSVSFHRDAESIEQ